MNNAKRTIKDILIVIVGNIINILSGVAVGFILPKILTVEEYGSYKTYILYITYLGLFSMGFVDGIVLKYGGFDYNQIDKKLFRAYFKFFNYLGTIFSVLLLLLILVVIPSNNYFVAIAVVLSLIPLNGTGYFQQVSQITRRFKELSTRKIIQSVATCIALFSLLLYCREDTISYKIYVIFLLMLNYIMYIWYIYTYKDIVFGTAYSFRDLLSDLKNLIRIGAPLMVGNLCYTLILNIDRQVVNIYFEKENFAIYSFAYSLLSLVTVAIAAVSTVFYPTFKRLDEKKLLLKFGFMKSTTTIIALLLISVYFPFDIFVRWYLPQYSESLPIVKIVLPGMVLTAVLNSVIHNYYKVYKMNDNFFAQSAIVLIGSTLIDILVYYVFGAMSSISIASIAVLFCWYVSSSVLFCKKNDIRDDIRSYILSILGCAFFYISMLISNLLLGWFIYLLGIVLLFAFLYGKSLINFKKNKI